MYSMVDVDNVLRGIEREREQHVAEGRILRELGERPHRVASLLAAFAAGVGAFGQLPRFWTLPSRAAEPCRVDAGV